MPLVTFTPKAVATNATQTVSRGPKSLVIREKLLQVFRDAYANTPRNLQTAIGPSQAGSPCARQIAFRLLRTPSGRSQLLLDPLPSIMGTAMHTWAGEALKSDNLRRPGSWLSEQRVRAAAGLEGNSDAFWLPERTVIDFKFLGNTQYRQYVDGYVAETYRAQIHLYGLGMANAGYVPELVALAIFGRAKQLRDLYVWSEPWSRSYAEDLVARLEDVATVVLAGVKPMDLPSTPHGGCYFCPYSGKVEDGMCPDREWPKS